MKNKGIYRHCYIFIFFFVINTPSIESLKKVLCADYKFYIPEYFWSSNVMDLSDSYCVSAKVWYTLSLVLASHTRRKLINEVPLTDRGIAIPKE